ncbi:MAG: bifunctional hydroxymethylpyrimidine kinase/phosphomethylpyrimidine kinase, partial [Verrucomicrobiales bacterium]
MSSPPPVVLTIAGSDCSAGAGLQADLKTFQHFHVHGLTAVTCVVSETANLVQAIHAVPPEFVADQVALLLDSFPVAAIKTGMLAGEAAFEAVVAGRQHDELSAYPEAFEKSWLHSELNKDRNFKNWFKYGLTVATVMNGFEQFVLRGRMPWTLRRDKADHE